MALASEGKTYGKATSRSNTGFGLVAPRKFNTARKSGKTAGFKLKAHAKATSNFPRNASSITKSIGRGEYAAPNKGYTTKMNTDKQRFGKKNVFAGKSSKGSRPTGKSLRAFPSDNQLSDHM